MSWLIGTDKQQTQFTLERLLDENDILLDVIASKLIEGKHTEAIQFQQVVQRNLMYLLEMKKSHEEPQSQ